MVKINFKDIKEFINLKIISIRICFFFIVSMHISLKVSKHSDEFIELISSKIPNYDIIFSILFLTFIFFSILNFVDLYFFELKYIIILTQNGMKFNDEEKLSSEEEKKLKDFQMKKVKLTDSIILITYFISVFKFYKHMIWYLIILVLILLIDRLKVKFATYYITHHNRN